MTPPASLLRTIVDAWNDAYALAFPVTCAGCGVPGAVLCDGCRRVLAPAPRSTALSDGLIAHSGLAFEGVAAAAVRALKQEGRTGIARHLAPALGAAVEAALAWAHTGALDPPGVHASPRRADRVAIVPVPTSRASMRRRGYRVVELLARRADIPTLPVLAPARRVGDQRHLGRDARHENVRGAFRIPATRATALRGCTVLVIDDVVTTGATLAAAAHALREAGARVIGAATVAATPLRMAQPDDLAVAPMRTRHDSPEKDG